MQKNRIKTDLKTENEKNKIFFEIFSWKGKAEYEFQNNFNWRNIT